MSRIWPTDSARRWTRFDAQGAQRDTGLVASQAIAAALVIRDICRAQISGSTHRQTAAEAVLDLAA